MDNNSIRNTIAFANSYLVLCFGYMILRLITMPIERYEVLENNEMIFIILIISILLACLIGLIGYIFFFMTRKEEVWLARKRRNARYPFSCNKEQVPYVVLSIAVTCLIIEIFLFG